MLIKDNTALYWKGERYMFENNFQCGYCGSITSSVQGMSLRNKTNPNDSEQRDDNNGVYICTHCKMPTFLWQDIQVPGLKYGSRVENLPDMIDQVYTEARNAFSSGAYTGVVLLCRKLLMHISVELGAGTNLKFIEYVNYLEDKKHITVRSKDWVDSIRKSGNTSTHEIEIASKEEAERMIKFSEMILKTNFEYPAEFGI
ncbi:DUF4145 domain-containing protein [Jeotgalibaca dankookensis]|uniref:DUF4145 domain-containing protein n=1 Tax=Jeotgalibaca dankookensis TaxID=708126 RepID=UPI000783ED0C|nr:DUF4145 domain-containing protein [Jeotgalibaca dankookensis]